jgi:hypothetical protein
MTYIPKYRTESDDTDFVWFDCDDMRYTYSYTKTNVNFITGFIFQYTDIILFKKEMTINEWVDLSRFLYKISRNA